MKQPFYFLPRAVDTKNISFVDSSNTEAVQKMIKGCVEKDRESQKMLYKHFYSYAMSVCLRFASNNEDAVEILNDGFMKVFTKTDRYNPSLSFKGWLRKILINTALDHYRKNLKFSHNQPLSGNGKEYVYKSETALDKLSYEELVQMIQRLSPAYRAVFNLYVIEGYSHEEIAKLLAISIGTSKSNLSKARANLRDMLQKTERKEYAKY